MPLPNIHHVSVVRVESLTPRMLRVTFAGVDVAPFVGGEMHVRLLLPPEGRALVLPTLREDGSVEWPRGEDEIRLRAYTIRGVDSERGEFWIDFLQHPSPGSVTPGGDFARDAQPGDRAVLLGPGSGHLPDAANIILIGDETALPAIARIAAEVPANTRMKAVIEVENEAEEQPIPSAGLLDLCWLHRDHNHSQRGALAREAREMIEAMEEDTFVWVACEKEDVRSIRTFLKKRGQDPKRMYVAWYWERLDT